MSLYDDYLFAASSYHSGSGDYRPLPYFFFRLYWKNIFKFLVFKAEVKVEKCLSLNSYFLSTYYIKLKSD